MKDYSCKAKSVYKCVDFVARYRVGYRSSGWTMFYFEHYSGPVLPDHALYPGTVIYNDGEYFLIEIDK